MNKLRHYLNNVNLSRFRFRVQLAAFALLIYGGFPALNIGDQLPSFSCVFDQNRGGSCYLFGFQHQMSMPFSRLLGGAGIGVLIGLATFFLYFIVLNKGWCGFICPLGTVQDLLTRLRQKFKIRNSEYNEPTFRSLKLLKYLLLFLLILLPMAIGNSIFGLPQLSHDFATPFCMICPGRTILPLFSGDVSQLVIDFSSSTKIVLSGLGMAITGIFLAGAFVKKRFICLFCPMSALHYLFHKAGLLRLTKNGAKCSRCGNCYRTCDAGIRAIADDLEHKNIVKDDCMMCFKCVEVCPEEGCLQVSFLGLPVFEATSEGFFKRMEEKNREQ